VSPIGSLAVGLGFSIPSGQGSIGPLVCSEKGRVYHSSIAQAGQLGGWWT